MKQLIVFIMVFAPSAALAGPLKVVTTTSDLADITRQIAGDHAEVMHVCKGGQDPHFIQAKPSYMRAVADADLFIRIGMDLEIAWESALLRGARNPRVQLGTPGHLDVSAVIPKLGVPTQTVDRSMGDVHAQGNPHYWLDPYNGRLIAKVIAERLGELVPAHRKHFAANLGRFLNDLDGRMFGGELVKRFGGDTLWQHELRGGLAAFLTAQKAGDALGGWKKRGEALRGLPIIGFHTSWRYFAERFGVNIVAQLEPKPGIPPSPAHLLWVIQTAKAQKARLILIEPYYDGRVADFVGGKTGVPVRVQSNAAGDGSDGYLGMLDALVVAVEGAGSGS